MRQLLVDSMPDADNCVCVTGKDARYLTQVLRLCVGELVDVRLPSGELARLRCKKIEGRTIILQTENNSTVENLNGNRSVGETGISAAEVEKTSCHLPELWLFQCMPKPQKMDIIIRQAAEIGVSRIVPVMSRFAFTDRDDCLSRISRWERVVKEARQQSGSAVATTLDEPVSIAQALERWKLYQKDFAKPAASFIFTEYPIETKPLYRYLTYKPTLIAAAVGPEGGFSTEEQSVFVEAGFLPLHFNVNILRTETASLYGLAVVQNVVMEFDSWRLSE